MLTDEYACAHTHKVCMHVLQLLAATTMMMMTPPTFTITSISTTTTTAPPASASAVAADDDPPRMLRYRFFSSTIPSLPPSIRPPVHMFFHACRHLLNLLILMTASLLKTNHCHASIPFHPFYTATHIHTQAIALCRDLHILTDCLSC
jgi:hypothetical protein